MDNEAAADILAIGVGPILALAVIQFMLMPALLASYRQKLFALRRELFLIMLDERIAPTDPAYVRLRYTLNGSIRFAHRMTFGRMVLTMATDIPKGVIPSTSDAIDAVEDEDLKADLLSIHMRAVDAVMTHALLVSPSAWITIGVGIVVVVATIIARGARGSWNAARNRALGLVEVLSSPEDEPTVEAPMAEASA